MSIPGRSGFDLYFVFIVFVDDDVGVVRCDVVHDDNVEAETLLLHPASDLLPTPVRTLGLDRGERVEDGGPPAGCEDGLGHKQRGLGPGVVVLELEGEALQEVGDTHGVRPGTGAEGSRPEVVVVPGSRGVDDDHLGPGDRQVL